jgi:hypothetical protein
MGGGVLRSPGLADEDRVRLKPAAEVGLASRQHSESRHARVPGRRSGRPLATLQPRLFDTIAAEKELEAGDGIQ